MYHNIDRNWELLATFAGERVTVPAFWIAGDSDLVMYGPAHHHPVDIPPELHGTIMLSGCGHWTQQERAQEVNAAMIQFLRGL